MTAQIIPFKFKEAEVRTIEKNSLVWFVAGDIAIVLGYRDSEKMTRILDADEKGTHNMGTPGGDQQITIINESGLYHALLKSRKPEAKPFRKWVTAEVLPAIRRNGQYQAHSLKTKTALPNGLTLDQCDAIKALVKARAESCPKEKQGAAAIKCWSSIKSKFGCSYKEIPPEHFTEALSLVARIELEGEYLPAGTPELPPIDVAAVLKDGVSGSRKVPLSADAQGLVDRQSFILALEAHNYLREHLTAIVLRATPPSQNEATLNKRIADDLTAVTLGRALTYKHHEELSWIATQAANMRAMALDLEARIRSECVTRPLISA